MVFLRTISLVAVGLAGLVTPIRQTFGYSNLAVSPREIDLRSGASRKSGNPPGFASRPHGAYAGEQSGDMFGWSVSAAGDVDGDGLDDFVVGAWMSDGGGANSGRAYLYLGAPSSKPHLDLVLTGQASYENFGSAVAKAGDLNADGFGDLVVGGPALDFPANSAGRAYVFLGGLDRDQISDLTLAGQSLGDTYGVSVCGAGDVNGDGYDDLVIGASRHNGPSPRSGRVYVYFGGASLDSTADLVLTGEGADDYFGGSVSTAGDVNGDGYADLIVGAEGNEDGGSSAGRAYVYYGGTPMDSVPDVLLTGQRGDGLGNAVASAGDVNGDGFSDVIVGAWAGPSGQQRGRANVYFGGSSMDPLADLELAGEGPGERFGWSVASAGDVNQDGYDDLIIGAYRNEAGGLNAGRAYVFLGGATPDTSPDLVLTGSPGEYFATSLSSAGDLTGDGFADILVGAYESDAAGSDAGRAYLYECGRYFILTPNGGESWWIGTPRSVEWLGTEPADVFLSLDDGATFSAIARAVGGNNGNSLSIEVPDLPTDVARIMLKPANIAVSGTDESDLPFSIRAPKRGINAWPNPYSQGVLTVYFSIDAINAGKAAYVAVYDLHGRLVRTLQRGNLAAGPQSLNWDGFDSQRRRVPSGVYFVHLRAGDQRATRPVQIVR